MHSRHTHDLGRFLARTSAVALVSASIGFAAPVLAAQPDDPGHSAAGRAHEQTHHHHAATVKERPAASPGGSQGASGVSIPKPNGFQAQADPDGMANGGIDQPGGTGGVDTSTQDGNNGSGNDADCEDDNRGVGIPGHCKDAPAAAVPTDDGAPAADLPTDSPTADQQVEAPVLQPERPAVDTFLAQAAVPTVFAPGTGAPATKAVTAAGVLPSTGAGQALLGLSLAALAALGLGTALVRQGRRARVTG